MTKTQAIAEIMNAQNATGNAKYSAAELRGWPLSELVKRLTA